MGEDIKQITVTLGSFPTLLTIVFIVLKLCNVINWSWVWVLSPVLIPFGIGIVVLIFVLILIGFGIHWLKKDF